MFASSVCVLQDKKEQGKGLTWDVKAVRITKAIMNWDRKRGLCRLHTKGVMQPHAS